MGGTRVVQRVVRVVVWYTGGTSTRVGTYRLFRAMYSPGWAVFMMDSQTWRLNSGKNHGALRCAGIWPT